MPLGQTVNLRSWAGYTYDFVLAPSRNGDLTVTRLRTDSAAGYPVMLQASGKTSRKTDKRLFDVDSVTQYYSQAENIGSSGALGVGTIGSGFTFNVPRNPAWTNNDVIAKLQRQITFLLQALNGRAFTAAEMTAIEPLLPLTDVPLLLNGIR